jgi:hypothetical protein
MRGRGLAGAERAALGERAVSRAWWAGAQRRHAVLGVLAWREPSAQRWASVPFVVVRQVVARRCRRPGASDRARLRERRRGIPFFADAFRVHENAPALGITGRAVARLLRGQNDD